MKQQMRTKVLVLYGMNKQIVTRNHKSPANQSGTLSEADLWTDDEIDALNENTIGFITVLVKMDIYVRFVKFFYESSSENPGGSRGAWSHRAVHFKDNPGKKLTCHNKSDNYGFALKSLTNLKNKDTLEKPDESNKEKSTENELYTEKLIKIVHFLARNNLPVKELYPKMIKHLSDEINEPIVKRYLETYPKNAAYDSSDSCDSILVALNSHLKEKLINTLINAVDLAIFADEATSAARKEMMGLFLSACYEEKK